MTQEEKDLVLRDLCARLPYGVKTYYKTAGWEDKYCTISPQVIDNMLHRSDVVVKPYLRPTSSMTGEETKNLCDNLDYVLVFGEKFYDKIPEFYDWLNEHHFDYRGLIEKGLAISTEEFNPYKD